MGSIQTFDSSALGVQAQEWLNAQLDRYRPSSHDMLVKACQVAEEAHSGQARASGEPYISHPLAVASLLAELDLDAEAITAAILHDVVEDSDTSLDAIREQFGPMVAALVDGVTKMDVIDDLHPDTAESQHNNKQVEALRKLLLAMVDDVRVVLIKLADRLHNMRTLGHLKPEKRTRIARETVDIYAPLASRLGIWQFKWEMEDLAFRHLSPQIYANLAKSIDERRVDRESYIDSVVQVVRQALEEADISANVSGRPKHIYSIWRKLKNKGLQFDELYDIRAVRVLVDSVTDCYAALGVVHTLWQHVPKEFDDYITNPKSNMYQSLHTAVIGPQGKTLEVQIRTHEMHAHAEWGVAAHWKYKQQVSSSDSLERKVSWLRQVVDWKDERAGNSGFLEQFQAEVLHDRVYVISPKGTVFDLPVGATPLDFAYQVHSDVGHRCRGAKVDGRIVPLTYQLRSGDKVEVLTSRHGGPSRDWLNANLGFVTTARAKYRIRHWFRQQDYEKNLAAGREQLDRDLKRVGIERADSEKLTKRFNFNSMDDLMAAVGHGDLTTAQVINALQDHLPKPQRMLEPRTSVSRENVDGVRISGVGNLLTQFAKCCKPVPPDLIQGYITRGRGVTVHRRDCSNALRLVANEPDRVIDVGWADGDLPENTYAVDVAIAAYDRQGLLRDVSTVVANEKVNVVAMRTHTDPKKTLATMDVTIEVHDLNQLSRLLDRLGQLPNVYEVHRKT